MGFFAKKEKRYCPVCGSEMTFFGSKMIADGEICEKCEKMIRGQFDIEEYWKRRWGTDGLHSEDYRLKTSDPLTAMTIAEVVEMVRSKKEEQNRIISDFGSQYANIAKVESSLSIAPGPLEVGIKRSMELKNRIVATSFIIAGEFKRGDKVILSTDGRNTETRILDVFLCSNSTTFETVLGANTGKHMASAGESAWILLDVTEGVCQGTLIQK